MNQKPYETDEFGMTTSCCDGGKMCAVNPATADLNSHPTIHTENGSGVFVSMEGEIGGPVIGTFIDMTTGDRKSGRLIVPEIDDEPEILPAPFTLNGDVSVTLNERESTHGPFKLNAECTQRAEDVYRSMPGYPNLSYVQRESLHMTLHKLARMVNGDAKNKDHAHDAAGYMTLAETVG
jgi:hypothetical protein